MKLLEKILVPIDVNMDSKEQLNTAIKIARLGNSEIIIMHVLPEDGVNEAIKDIVINNATEVLNKIQGVFEKEGLKVQEQIMEYGNPVKTILKVATEENVDLILMGSGSIDSKDGNKRGSTTENLMRQSEKPVWVVKSDRKNKLSKILCPVDFSEPSSFALKNAILLAKFFNADLTILGVYGKFSSLSVRFKDEVEKENARRLEEMENEMKTFLENFDLQGLNFTVEIKSGLAHVQILKSIKEDDHDLLIMGTHGRSGLNRFVMGSVTEKVTREVPCSFITTRTDNILDLKFDDEIKDLESNYKQGNALFDSGDYKQAIGKYLICIQINSMHIPSLYKLANIFKIIDDKAKAEYYSNLAKDMLITLWDETIEKAITKHYTSNN
ncbi:hypothetical protein FEZ18_08075 [Oceanihabitans sp. IOP_32]|uniref:universal stress protein n=1 Tax=Oceanihabitans sp. IOP_32 TaxID=2529032 RepID=UPI001293E9A9|nr:universal stress protein [Oceanihabitans sp. IOP_32]QFZ54756.1 hypothetical protein FEZ18_08075 [Oceanihabitans sp. IOP_32]